MKIELGNQINYGSFYLIKNKLYNCLSDHINYEVSRQIDVRLENQLIDKWTLISNHITRDLYEQFTNENRVR